MGNAATASKHPDSGRAFSPDFTPAGFSPRDLTASPYPDDGIHVPKNKILRHMTSDGDNDDDRCPDDEYGVSLTSVLVHVILMTTTTGHRVEFVPQQSSIRR